MHFVPFHISQSLKIPMEKSTKIWYTNNERRETAEELEKIKALEVPVMSQAIEAYYTITASSEFRERERLRAKARHDEAQALHNAELKGEAKGRQEERFNLARNMISDGESVEKIIRYTSLTRKEVELLYEQ